MSIVQQTKDWLASSDIDTSIATLVNEKNITVRDLMCAIVLRANNDNELFALASDLLDSMALDLGLLFATLSNTPQQSIKRFNSALQLSVEMHEHLRSILPQHGEATL